MSVKEPADVSAIIVNWNSRHFLENCLDSLLKEGSACSTEIIVVDNASTDGSQEMVKRKYANVKLIENRENLGFSKANNIGIEQSTGLYLALINPDVVLNPSTFNEMKSFMESHPSVGLLGPKIIGVDGKVQRSCMEFPTLWNHFCRVIGIDRWVGGRWFGGQLMTYFRHDRISKVDVINGCFWFVQRKALAYVGPLDERFFIYAEDIDWCKRFKLAGWDNIFLPSVEAIHFGGGSSSNSPIRFNVEMQRANYQYWNKYHSQLSVRVFMILSFLGYLFRILTNGAAFVCSTRKRSIFKQKMQMNFHNIRWLLHEAGANRGRFEMQKDAFGQCTKNRT